MYVCNKHIRCSITTQKDPVTKRSILQFKWWETLNTIIHSHQISCGNLSWIRLWRQCKHTIRHIQKDPTIYHTNHQSVRSIKAIDWIRWDRRWNKVSIPSLTEIFYKINKRLNNFYWKMEFVKNNQIHLQWHKTQTKYILRMSWGSWG